MCGGIVGFLAVSPPPGEIGSFHYFFLLESVTSPRLASLAPRLHEGPPLASLAPGLAHLHTSLLLEI